MFALAVGLIFGPWIITMLWLAKLLVFDTFILGIWEGLTDE